ncbi:universal stress protein [Aestuariispira insulae]|uniref:Universal stress protein n=1 Tax=Aestuariispira insulae TaxID=1461337 RepID=A0A3D9HI13_9PROT|nr:universal stress protein [Aestuariispira insulae]RED49159.1 nucleotide-binding universal stress UspA family protein [Aestuariispira insulae]
MFNHILLAIDLGQPKAYEKSLPNAIEYAQKFGSTLHVMTVVPDFGMSIVGSFFPKEHEGKMLTEANNQLHDFVKQNIPDSIPVQHIVGHGTAYEEILRVSEDINCDLIILGSHRPKMQDYLLGPNAARVVRHANCSVLVVRG